jgi:hypothetical protein
MKLLRAGLLGCMVALALPAAIAGPQTVRGVDGVQWHVEENDDSDTEDYLIEKTGADRKRDRSYGRDGRMPFEIGPSDFGSVSLRVDTQGRAWVLGTTMAAATAVPVLLRFLPDGQPDTGWGARGRNNAGPPGQRAVGMDLMPMADGTAWVAGSVAGSRNDQRAALWRMTRQGAVDMEFGPGGSWQRPGSESSQTLVLLEGDRGELVFGILVRTTSQQMLEVWSLARDAKSPTLLTSEVATEDVDEDITLQRRGNTWAWVPGPVAVGISGAAAAPAVEPGAPAIAASGPVDVGHSGYSPFITAEPASSAPASTELAIPWEMLITTVILLIAGIAIWRARAGRS